ncbi:MAG: hypothetical protein OSB60_00130 [Myxococcota bacterium]|nr:hypothetical protein [Myxococcota bacterium]
MDPFIECVGDPRAMGHGQGLAHRAEIQARIAAAGGRVRRSRLPSLRALTSGGELGSGIGREVIRHYTHLAERMAGIARNADVPFASLMDLFCAATETAGPDDDLVAPAIAIGTRETQSASGGPLVLRTLSGASLESSPWILRKSRPEVGFSSAEVTLPWLATAIAGINDAGVAVAMAPRTASYGGGVNAGAVNPRHAPHGVLLVQECLQRFEDIDGCIDWCRKRPRSGNVSLVIGDANGGLATVKIEGDECRVVDAGAGIAVEGAMAPIRDRIVSQYGDQKQIDLDALVTAHGGESQPAHGCLVWLEPARRSLSLRSTAETGSAGKSVDITL